MEGGSSGSGWPPGLGGLQSGKGSGGGGRSGKTKGSPGNGGGPRSISNEFLLQRMKEVQATMHIMKMEIAALQSKNGQLCATIDALHQLQLNTGAGYLDSLEQRVHGLELQVADSMGLSGSCIGGAASMATELVGDLLRERLSELAKAKLYPGYDDDVPARKQGH